MLTLGNTVVNRIYEHNLRTSSQSKPTAKAKHEDKERFIRAKYDFKEFLVPLPPGTDIKQSLKESVTKMDIKQVALLLAHASLQALNISFEATPDGKTLLHLAAIKGCLEIVQLLLWVSHSKFVKFQYN